MARFKCIGTKHRGAKKLSSIEVMTSRKLKGRRVYLKLDDYPETIIGFWSYDGRGIVYEHPRGMMGSYCFFPIFKYQRLRWAGGGRSGRSGYYIIGGGHFNYCINKAIQNEISVCQDLETKFKDVNVVRLPQSGVNSGGADILITHEKIDETMMVDKEYYRFWVTHWVRNSIIQIEVLGVYKRESGKLRFTYPVSKDFIQWRKQCWDNGTIPVIAWIEGEQVYYVILWSDDYVKHIFWTKHNEQKYGYRQRTNFGKVENTDQYKVDVKGLYNEIKEIRQIKRDDV